MADWTEFFLAAVAFLLSHVLPVRQAPRQWLAAKLGERGFLDAYSVVSIGLLAWLVVAAGRAPYVVLWEAAEWQRWVPNLAMPVACLLIGFGAGAPNPLSFGGRRAGFEPKHPGITGVSRHPLLLAITLWAAAHAVANGDLAHGLLFGTFTVFALLGMVAIDRRKRRQMGEETWRRLASSTSLWPLAALVNGRWRPRGLVDPWRLALSLLLWMVLLALHAPLIGVAPLPIGVTAGVVKSGTLVDQHPCSTPIQGSST